MENKTKIPLLNIDGLSVITERGIRLDRKTLPNGEYTQETLLNLLADDWVPLMECHKCGRFSYCKFVERYPNDPKRGKQIQCGVVLTVLKNFLAVSWERLPTYSPTQLQNFFDGLYYFVQFIYEAEVAIGNLLNDEYLDWAGSDLARKNFGFIAHLRAHIDKFAGEFRELNDYGTLGRWFSVEGEAEQEFIERLGELKFYTAYVGGVENYGGKGNAKPSKLSLYLNSLKNRGYSVAIQGDMDSGKTNRLDALIAENLVERELTFPFSKDFEGSFPPPVLHKALSLSGYDIPLERLTNAMERKGENVEPIAVFIEKVTSQKISKVKLARNLAEVVASNWSKIIELYPNSEIIKWLEFLRAGRL